MKKLMIVLLLATAKLSLFAQTTWVNDKQHTQTKFIVTHLAVSSVTGWFKGVDIKIAASKPDFSDAKFWLIAKTDSIFTGVAPRDADLRSPHVFDSGKYPELTFTSTKLIPVGKGKYKVTGNFTMHGITKVVSLNLWYRGTVNNPISKSLDAGFQVTGTVKRSDFNLASMYPPPILSDEITILADAEFGKAK